MEYRYEKPEMEIIYFGTGDVITTSDTTPEYPVENLEEDE